MGLMDITIDTSLHSHGDTLFASGTKILKCLYYAVSSSGTQTVHYEEEWGGSQ